MLNEMIERLEAASGHIEMSFPYFVNKSAPVSGVQSLMDYEVSFTGEFVKGKTHTNVKVVIPVTIREPNSPAKLLRSSWIS